MGSMAVKMKICFFHLFKCGGTTFNWILQNNFPDNVLYVESLIDASVVSRLHPLKITFGRQGAMATRCSPPISLSQLAHN